MLPFIIRRLLVSIPLLLVSSFLVFVMVANAGDPLQDLRMNPRTTPGQIAQAERNLNLDKPVLDRYQIWIADVVLRQDLGLDNTQQSVGTQLNRALKVTLRLVIAAIFVAVILGLAVGVVSALRQYSLFDYSATFAAFLFFSLPVFWLGVLLKEFVAIPANDWLEGLGFSRFFGTVQESTAGFEGSFWARMGDYAGHLILPAFTLVVISFAQYSRYTRASMLETMNSDYVRTAQAKGLSRRRVVIRHGLRNALIPVTTVIAIDFGAVLGGAIITETVFQWKGMGTLLIDNVRQYDVNMVLGWLLVVATTVVVFNLIADVIYAYLDPRIRLD
ncbi:ABC transporter permease [soil metagenome]